MRPIRRWMAGALSLGMTCLTAGWPGVAVGQPEGDATKQAALPESAGDMSIPAATEPAGKAAPIGSQPLRSDSASDPSSASGSRAQSTDELGRVGQALALSPKPSVALPSAPPQAPEKSRLIVTSDYSIGPEDVLEITVWRNQELSKQVAVRPDGRISLPLIGDVTAVGKTPAQLTDEITVKLKDFKENPNVAIVVREVNSYSIFVLGEVTKPGRYPLKSKTTLLQGITIAGGFTQVAARNNLVVFRLGDNGNGEEKIRASYDDIVLREGSRQNIELKPGDTVVVPSETMVLIP